MLTVAKDSAVLFKKEININKDVYFEKVNLLLEAKKGGLQKYTIHISRLDHELSYKNNKMDIFVDVLDSKQKILLLASAVHPDISALRSVLEKNENYECDFSLVSDFKKNLQAYNLIIFHQPFLNPEVEAISTQILKNNTPTLFIFGANTNIDKWNANSSFCKIYNNKGKISEAEAYKNDHFSFFTISDGNADKIKKFPPLITPFGDYKYGEEDHALLLQKIGIANTVNPILFFGESEAKKYGVLCGEGIWRWKMQDLVQNSSSEAFDEIFSKSIQFLSLRENKNKFRVNYEEQYMEDEAIVFEAQLYNDNYELINDEEVKLEITNAAGKIFQFSFGRTQKAYEANIGVLPIGNYTFKAEVSFHGKRHQEKGKFSIIPIQLEGLQTTANHSLLYKLANDHGGKMYYPNQLDQLASELIKREDIKPLLKNEKKFSDLVNLKWIFYLLLLLLTLEWFVRKYNGIG